MDGAFGVEQHGLGRGGRDIEPEDVAHRSVLSGPDDPALAVGRHTVGRDLAQRTERLELAELVAEVHLDRRAAIRVERVSLDIDVLLEHGAVPLVGRPTAAGRDADLQPGTGRDGVDDDHVGRQAEAGVGGIRVRPQHQGAVCLRPGGVRRRRDEHASAERQLRDAPMERGVTVVPDTFLTE